MLVSNYYKLLAGNAFGGGAVKGKSISGGTITIYPNGQISFNMASAISTGTGYIDYIRVGTGTTPPTMNDYNLSGSQITTITSTYVNNGVTSTEDGASKSVTYTITNTGSDPITIGEIAVFAGIKTTSSGSYVGILIERTVLDVPLTIPAGEIGRVTYTINFTYPVE